MPLQTRHHPNDTADHGYSESICCSIQTHVSSGTRTDCRFGVHAKTDKMIFKHGHDQRCYNAPRHDEVAAVFVGDIAVYPRDEPCKIISYMSANCDPMTTHCYFQELNWVDDTWCTAYC